MDDFSFKKRHTYGTVIVDEVTHNTVAVLADRDGKSLKEWLKKNKHVKIVTRDRASAYAKVIIEKLPDAIQIVDRFHLHQNLLEAIRKAIGGEIPAIIAIDKEPVITGAIPSQEMMNPSEDEGKKIEPIVDNLSDYRSKDVDKLIQEFQKEGCSVFEISRRVRKNWKTIAKYCEGDPDILCPCNKAGILDIYKTDNCGRTSFKYKSIQDNREGVIFFSVWKYKNYLT